MDQNNNNNQTMNNNPAAGEKTFTQDEVNRIVSDRLARERDKRTAELDEKEKTLRQRELAIIAREKLEEAGLNKELCSVLRYEDEESLDKAIQQLTNIQGFKATNEKKENKLYEAHKLPDNPESYPDYDEKQQLRKAMGLR